MGSAAEPADRALTPPRPRGCTHFVYIVRCADESLYTGYARDPHRRTAAHNAGRGARYTAGRRPVALVYLQGFRSHGRALAREFAIKQLTRSQKEALIARGVAGRTRRGAAGEASSS